MVIPGDQGLGDDVVEGDRCRKPPVDGVHGPLEVRPLLRHSLDALTAVLQINAFMQASKGAAFNPVTMRMELQSFAELFFSHDVQSKFVHTSIAGY